MTSAIPVSCPWSYNSPSTSTSRFTLFVVTTTTSPSSRDALLAYASPSRRQRRNELASAVDTETGCTGAASIRILGRIRDSIACS
ncbi:hypothetical protein CPC08DRAFT_707625 [Agrocybe pediades]|nr:hypothetical protein CPC08DRAFT_707625 [Agrocybe pediades]